MTEQTAPQPADDTEGHFWARATGEPETDDTEGHRVLIDATGEPETDDTEGNRAKTF